VTTTYDHYLERIEAGGRLEPGEIRELAATRDILALGMLADALRRRLHGRRTTFLRVAIWAYDRSFSDAVPPAAREVRLIGAPEALAVAAAAVGSARAVAGGRTVAAFSWPDVERLAAAAPARVAEVLDRLRAAGLDALAELPLDAVAQPAAAVERLLAAGFSRLRLTVQRAPAAERVGLLLAAADLQDRYGGIQAINPLPAVLDAARPTTGYEDVKMVALARLAAPQIPSIQVDWRRYGPKLAQVALTFGADDIDGVSASDEAPHGRRRAPLEEIRRNIEAAGFEPIERSGTFEPLVTVS
jgi:2-iminoacetate synthase ThiH